MLQDTTNEFSLILKPSTVCDAVGVFALHDIAADTKLMVQPDDYVPRIMRKEDIPEALRSYCEPRPEDDGTYFCPHDFSAMYVSWYLNHANNPNVRLVFPDTGPPTLTHYAARDIQAGEELLVDYNEFHEPAHATEVYYRS